MFKSQGQNIFELSEIRNKTWVFKNREHAGKVLAKMMQDQFGSHAIVLAVPAGGVPIAKEIAQELKLPLDVCVVSKMTLPWNTECGFGALSFNGIVRLNNELVDHFRLDARDVRQGIEKTQAKVKNRLRRFRKGRAFPNLSKQTCILVDDGLASGFTMEVAIEAMKKEGASDIIIAVPTAHEATVNRIASQVSAIYCPNIRGGYGFAVAEAYQDWHDVAGFEAEQILSGA